MTKAFALGPDEGEAIWYLGGLGTWKITAEQTGSWGFAVEVFPPGLQTARHIHHTEDGAFYILDGVLLMHLGDLEIEATPGAFVYMPRNVPHDFKVISATPARWINVQGPAGDFRKLAKEIGEPATTPSLPPTTSIPGNAAGGDEIRRKYGVEIIAPPPDLQP